GRVARGAPHHRGALGAAAVRARRRGRRAGRVGRGPGPSRSSAPGRRARCARAGGVAMSVINYAAQVINFKIVYYGPGVAGKTANLQSIHRCLPAENKGSMIALATGDDRTLFFDFLPVSALTVRGFATKFQLYTVPGQVYYNMTRKLVLRGVDGLVFVADSQWDRLRDN